jgi:hypothetical protein
MTSSWIVLKLLHYANYPKKFKIHLLLFLVFTALSFSVFHELSHAHLDHLNCEHCLHLNGHSLLAATNTEFREIIYSTVNSTTNIVRPVLSFQISTFEWQCGPPLSVSV